MKEFAICLKNLRTREGLTQKEISTELEISLSTYKNWEKCGAGHRMPDIKMMIKLADILNTTLDELVGR